MVKVGRLNIRVLELCVSSRNFPKIRLEATMCVGVEEEALACSTNLGRVNQSDNDSQSNNQHTSPCYL